MSQQTASENTQQTQKKAYQSPAITALGSVQALTEQVAGPGGSVLKLANSPLKG